MLSFLALAVLAVGLIIYLAIRIDTDTNSGGLEYGMYAGLGFIGAFGCMDYLLMK